MLKLLELTDDLKYVLDVMCHLSSYGVGDVPVVAASRVAVDFNYWTDPCIVVALMSLVSRTVDLQKVGIFHDVGVG